METAVKIFFKEAGKTIASSPGWIPLLIISYIVFHLHPQITNRINVELNDFGNFKQSIKISNDIISMLVAFLSYKIGDLIDESIFPRMKKEIKEGEKKDYTGWKYLEGSEMPKARYAARETLKIESGIYSVSKQISSSLGGKINRRISQLNELAKFIRSLILPLGLYGIYNLFHSNYAIGLLIVLLALACVPIYGKLKTKHMYKLYLRMSNLNKEVEYENNEIDNYLFHFANNKLITSTKIIQSITSHDDSIS